MRSMASESAYTGYNSRHGVDYTWDWDFDLTYAVGQVSLYGDSGGGLHHTGVISYRYRPGPDSPDQTVNVGDPNNWQTWPPYAYADKCTGFTFGTAVGAEQEAYILANVFFW